jgi:hypothetical protein
MRAQLVQAVTADMGNSSVATSEHQRGSPSVCGVLLLSAVGLGEATKQSKVRAKGGRRSKYLAIRKCYEGIYPDVQTYDVADWPSLRSLTFTFNPEADVPTLSFTTHRRGCDASRPV